MMPWCPKIDKFQVGVSGPHVVLTSFDKSRLLRNVLRGISYIYICIYIYVYIYMYIVIIRLVVALSKSSQARKMKEAPFFKRVLGASTTSAVVYGGSSW